MLISFNSKCQENISFELSYDKSGNLQERKIQTINLGRFNSPSNTNDSLPQPAYFNVSPNPSNTFINIEVKDRSEFNTANIQLYTLTGQLIKTIPYYGENLKKIDVSGLLSGLYLLTINYSPNEREIHKIIIND